MFYFSKNHIVNRKYELNASMDSTETNTPRTRELEHQKNFPCPVSASHSRDSCMPLGTCHHNQCPTAVNVTTADLFLCSASKILAGWLPQWLGRPNNICCDYQAYVEKIFTCGFRGMVLHHVYIIRMFNKNWNGNSLSNTYGIENK